MQQHFSRGDMTQQRPVKREQSPADIAGKNNRVALVHLIMRLTEQVWQGAGVRATNNGEITVSLQVGRVIHGVINLDVNFVQNNSGDTKLPVLYRLGRHQGLVYRADTIIDNDDDRQLQCASQVGI